ncbi:MAG: LAGLIDADG family homing endonuclease [Nanobdellota archaeon]
MDQAKSAQQEEEKQMETTEHIRRFKQFVEDNYYGELLETVRKGLKHISIDFSSLIKFDPDLSEELLENPEDVLKACEVAVTDFDFAKDIKKLYVRFYNLPSNQHLMIRNIRSEHIGKFLHIEGIVRQKTDVRPQVTNAKFECPSCGNVISVLQLDSKFKEPTRCGCGRKGKFMLMTKELVDAQGIVLEESPDGLEGGEQPKRMNVFLKADLVSPLSDKKTNPGTKIILNGFVKEVPVTLNTGGTSTRYDLLIEANYVDSSSEDFGEIEITQEEEDEILDLAENNDINKKLVESVAPSVYGYDKIKEALLYQMVGGIKKERTDGGVTRGDMHVLLIGDPGSGKSQLLKRMSKVAPKARFVSGKGASGAGLTASVVKDEFLKGWSLEAGALVLANKGMCAIDELDKMTDEDRSAMHEALEGQSYHPETEIRLSDGTRVRMGNLVEKIMKEEKKVEGIRCEFSFPKDISMVTTDFNQVYETNIDRISRHTPPEYFVRFTFQNGRTIKVTPEHPMWVYRNGKFVEVPADSIKGDELVPCPKRSGITGESQTLEKVIPKKPNNKPITFPEYLSRGLSKLLGYFISEGHSHNNPSNRYAEIGISTTSDEIKEEVKSLFEGVFETSININIHKKESRKRATLDLYTIRCPSKPLYEFFRKNFPELLCKAPLKRAPQVIMKETKEIKTEFLCAAFRGDGYYDNSDFGFTTASRKLAEDYQDLLLDLGITSIIRTEERGDKRYFKTIITSPEGKKTFSESVIDRKDERLEKVKGLTGRSYNKANYRDTVPIDMVLRVKNILKSLKIDDGYFTNVIKRGHNSNRRTVMKHVLRARERINKIRQTGSFRGLRRNANIHVKDIAETAGCSPSTVYNHEEQGNTEMFKGILEQKMKNKLEPIEEELEQISRFLESDLSLMGIKEKDRVTETVPYVYDVTMFPNQTFISQGAVLHNTITISKANIQATLRSQTTVLAAANPKFGRFDPYEVISKQIDLPPTLINRFDLIFPVRDLPDQDKDDKMASFILNLHKNPTGEGGEISTELIRKYIAYARQKITPQLTNNAIEEIKRYYIKMRQKGQSENEVKSVPISARQLEALVRIAESSAKLRLSNKVSKLDAKRAVELLHYSLAQVGFDPETGEIDIDRITTGITTTERSKIVNVREIINELEDKFGKTIPIEEIINAASEKGMTEEKVEESIEKLKRSGDIFEPRRGFISKI